MEGWKSTPERLTSSVMMHTKTASVCLWGFFSPDLPPKWVKVVTQINRREGVVVMNTKCHGSE